MEKHAAVLDPTENAGTEYARLRKSPQVSVIVVSTNEARVLDTCLNSVLANENVDLECLVVNNACTDETSAIVSGKYDDPRVRMIKNERRKSLSENCNIGLRRARGRYVLILNPDTRLMPNTIRTMIHFMDVHPEAAFSTCRLLNLDGSPQDHIRRFPTPWRVLLRLLRIDKAFPNLPVVRKYLMKDIDRSKTQEVEWFLLAFFFIRAESLKTIGGVDERFMRPYYCEDIEWCYRARINGYKNYCVAETFAYHEYQQRSRKQFGRLTVVHAVNNLLLYQKLLALHVRKLFSRANARRLTL